MTRRPAVALVLVLSLVLVMLPGSAVAAEPRGFAPGAPGVGDPYYRFDGNGGYDVKHYDLTLRYDPATDRLVGTARITALATQDLSRFNLDFNSLTLRSITVDGAVPATFEHEFGELAISPQSGIPALRVRRQ